MTTKTAQRAPGLPWRTTAADSIIDAGGDIVALLGLRRGPIHERASRSVDELADLGAFIVRAVNHHAALLDALEYAERVFRNPQGNPVEAEIDALTMMRAAIRAAAEGA